MTIASGDIVAFKVRKLSIAPRLTSAYRWSSDRFDTTGVDVDQLMLIIGTLSTKHASEISYMSYSYADVDPCPPPLPDMVWCLARSGIYAINTSRLDVMNSKPDR